MKCVYVRTQGECRFPLRDPIPCDRCLMGQQIEVIGLLSGAVMNAAIDKFEDSL